MRHARVPGLAVVAILLACTVAAAQAPQRISRGNLLYDGIPGSVIAAPGPPAAWQAARGARLLDWLADGSLLVAAHADNAVQLRRVRAPPATPQVLVGDAGAVEGAAAHPYNANVAVVRRNLDGNAQLWLRDFATGSERRLTDGKSRRGPPVFAHDGRRIAFSANARDAHSTDLFVADIDGTTAARLLLSGGSDELLVQDWSPDDRYLAVIRRRAAADSELLLVDVASGMITPVEPPPPSPPRRGRKPSAVAATSIGEARFARDGHGLYFTSDRGGEFKALLQLDLRTHQLATLTPAPRWDVERFDLSPDGRLLACSSNEGGLSRLVVRDLRLRADVLLPPLPVGAVIDDLRFDRRSDRLAVALQSATSPAAVFVFDLRATTAETLPEVTLAPWTQPGADGAASQSLAAELVEYPTWDQDGARQRHIPAFIFRPRAAGIHPVIIDIHDGPAAQFRPRWDALRRYLVDELGCIVIAPNVRGSSGYGRSFMQLDDGALREDAVRDIGALLVWIGAQRDFDRSRVVVMGRSYGGYLALAALAQYGDRLAGGIDIGGIGNLPAFLDRAAASGTPLRAEFGDERDADMRSLLTGLSPLSNAASIVRPLLIVQGARDERVPADEAEQLKALVRAHGTEVWYLAASDEDSRFHGTAARQAAMATTLAFLQQVFMPAR